MIISCFVWYSSMADAQQFESRENSATIGSPSLPFSATLLNGKKWKFKEGVPQVLIFTDSLCPYRHLPECEIKLEKLNILYKQFSSNSRWLTVVKKYYVTKDVVDNYINRFDIKYPATWDQKNELFSLYKVHNTPYVIVIDIKGNIVWRGDQINDDLSSTLAKLK